MPMPTWEFVTLVQMDDNSVGVHPNNGESKLLDKEQLGMMHIHHCLTTLKNLIGVGGKLVCGPL